MTVLLTVGATLFSCYSISHPKYTYRRLAAVLHLLTAVTVLAVIQLVEGGAEELVKLEEGASLLYGYSCLLAWSTFLASMAASIVFLAASRKRKLLDSDNVNFTHHKLDISVSQQSAS